MATTGDRGGAGLVLAPLGWLATPRGALVALHLGLLAAATGLLLLAGSPTPATPRRPRRRRGW